MKGPRRVVLALIVLVLTLMGLSLVAPPPYDMNWSASRVTFDTTEIAHACGAYRNSEKNAGKKFPTTIDDLIRPMPGGGGPFLDVRPSDLIDPWGNPYRYAVVTSANGEQEVYVWAERIVDGKLKLLGAKCCADGEVRRFGLE